MPFNMILGKRVGVIKKMISKKPIQDATTNAQQYFPKEKDA